MASPRDAISPEPRSGVGGRIPLSPPSACARTEPRRATARWLRSGMRSRRSREAA
jgi:hypothetical protein